MNHLEHTEFIFGKLHDIVNTACTVYVKMITDNVECLIHFSRHSQKLTETTKLQRNQTSNHLTVQLYSAYTQHIQQM